MVCVLLFKGIWTEVLAVTLLVLNPQVAAGRNTPKHFTKQSKCECYFVNGMEHVQYVERHMYNQKEYVHFDSNVGKYAAVMELGRPEAEYWNNHKEILDDLRARVDTLCRHNYQVIEPFLLPRSEAQSESAQRNMLSGVGGIILGLIFFGVGLIVHKRSWKGNRIHNHQGS